MKHSTTPQVANRFMFGAGGPDLAGALADLARFKHHKRCIMVDGRPRNAMGKVLKAELRARYADLFRK